MTTLQDLQTPCAPNFCPGCGDFSIWAAFKNAAVKEGWNNTNTVLTAGVGCHGHILNFVKINAFGSLHGRAVPVAEGARMANDSLNVFVFTGDGDSLAEGTNHYIHAARRNHDLTIILHDNAIYGLTTGQTSPRSPQGYKSKSTPLGNPDHPVNPLTLAIASGATFVSRVYASHIPQVTDMIIKANQHKGLAIVDILQPCITFNKEYDNNFYQDNTYYLGEDHDPKNKTQAFEKALEWGEKKIPLGIFYQEDSPSYESQIPQIRQTTQDAIKCEKRDITPLFEKFK
ncbi:thiamine pyrophosphate-dependent enzyme [Patescibacteria group bacterium]